jgi:hypothetical protein
MQETVYRVIGVLCAVVAGAPIGTNLGLLHLLWMLVSGQLLASRGAVIPGLSATGLSDPEVRRAWAALGRGDWSSTGLLAEWQRHVEQAGVWQAHEYAGYRPVAVDVTGFWRPRLQGLATSHYHGPAGKALPAIPVGMVARVGSVGTQRLGIPLALVRADATDPSTAAHERALVRTAVHAMAENDVLVLDAGFEIRQLQEAGATRYVVRAAKNITGRRAKLGDYPGRGRPRQRGELIRPLARTYRDRTMAASTPDDGVTWQEGDTVVRAAWWDDLVLADVPLTSPTFRLVVIYDPRWTEPLVLATTLAVPARTLRDLYLDRWPVEQLPLAAKQIAPSSPLQRPVSASRSSPSSPARSSPTSPPPSPPSPPAPGIAAHVRPRAASDASSAAPFSQPRSCSQTAFAKKPPSRPTCPPATGANDADQRPFPTLRALLARLHLMLKSPELPETKDLWRLIICCGTLATAALGGELPGRRPIQVSVGPWTRPFLSRRVRCMASEPNYPVYSSKFISL